MQAGLMNTYQHPVADRKLVAWLCSLALIVTYVLLYFGGNPYRGFTADPIQDLATAVGLDSKWTLYGLCYSLAMIVGGAFVLRRHGNSPYQRIRTSVVVLVQVVWPSRCPSR